MIKLRTSNLSELATGFVTTAQIESNDKRIQRFFRQFHFDRLIIIPFIIKLFWQKGQKYPLIMDQAIWYFGSVHVNILVISFAYRGVSISLTWKAFKGQGNSTTKQRITLLRKTIRAIGKKRIGYLLANREFVG